MAIRKFRPTSPGTRFRSVSDFDEITRSKPEKSLVAPLKKSGVFPPAVGYMVAVGEQSGELEDILETIANAYDEEIEIATQKMTALLEPVLILIMALVVAFIVLAILLPMLQLSKIG